MTCRHQFEHPTRTVVCGREAEFICLRCDGPRCADHVMILEGRLYCLPHMREALGLRRIAPSVQLVP